MDRKFEVILLGAYTRDRIITPQGSRIVDGGGFNYGAHVVAAMGKKTAAITRLALEDFSVLKELEALGVSVFAEASPRSTCLELEYKSANLDQRQLSLRSMAGPFTLAQVHGFSAEAFVISPSFRGEVPVEVIREIKKNNAFVSIDLQGYLRVAREDGRIDFAPWPEAAEILALAEVLKADAVEAERLTGESELRRAAIRLASYGPKEIVLSHNGGALVLREGVFFEAAFHPQRIVGRSGRGDTLIASYMASRIDHSPADSIVFAAAATSLKLEEDGPFRGRLADIESLIKTVENRG